MAVKGIATLGPKGWITDGQTMLDMVMAWAYASDASQSLFFSGKITSIAKIVHSCKTIESAAPALQSALKEYLSCFFDYVEVQVSVTEKELKGVHLLGELILRASMNDHSGNTLQLHEVMTKSGSVARSVIDHEPY